MRLSFLFKFCLQIMLSITVLMAFVDDVVGSGSLKSQKIQREKIYLYLIFVAILCCMFLLCIVMAVILGVNIESSYQIFNIAAGVVLLCFSGAIGWIFVAMPTVRSALYGMVN